jgi:hypothetical protein
MSEYWFKPKQRGYGAGMPIHWKGWALFGGYVGSILALPKAYEFVIGWEGPPLWRLAGVAAISVPFLWVAKTKTEGGWRWRKGDEPNDEYGS